MAPDPGTRVTGTLDILLVEDNLDLAQNIVDYLEALGHRIRYCRTGEEGLRDALEHPTDVVLLDVALPGRDGNSVCSELRRRCDIHLPIIMLTARDSIDDKLTGFASGADDYLVKPFLLAELSARVATVARRKQMYRPFRLVIGPLTIDRQARTAIRQGVSLRLSPILWELLLLLAEASPDPVTRTDLTRRLWGDEPPTSDALRSHIHLLRQVVDKPFDQPMIETIHGVGYRLDAGA